MSTTPPSLPWTVPHAHPAFDGHFPGQPILPGVVLLSAALEAAAGLGPAWALGPVHLASAKFLRPLRPGAVCEIRLQPPAPGASGVQRLRFEIREGEAVAASGVLERPAAEGPQ